MGNNAVVCLWIRSMSECVLNVVSQTVKEFQFCLEEEKCDVVGGSYGSFVRLVCFRDCCIICSCS